MAKGGKKAGKKPVNRAVNKAVNKPVDKPGNQRSKGPSRGERIEAERRRRRRRSRLLRYGSLGVIVVVLAGLVAWRLSVRRAEQRAIALMTSGTCTYDTRTDEGRVNEHRPNSSFEIDPPAGGVHDGSAASAGRYTEERRPEDGQIVHALEHGFIALWYRPDQVRDLDALESLAEEFSEDVLLLPRPTMEPGVATTAWHRRLLCESTEEPALRRFIERYRNKGPERVPRESAARLAGDGW